MQTETLRDTIEQRIGELLTAHPSHFLVEVRIKPTNNIKVFIDADEGVNLSNLVQYNRKLYRQLEESGMFPEGNFSLEISSPGLDEPLKMQRQYRKNVGRFVHITRQDGAIVEGKLIGLAEDTVTVETETGTGKKKIIKEEAIPFNDIKTTKIQIKF